MYPARQGKRAGRPVSRRWSFAQGQPGIEDIERGRGLELLYPAKPLIEFVGGKVNGIVVGKPQIGGVQPGDGVGKGDPAKPQLFQEPEHLPQINDQAAQGHRGHGVQPGPAHLRQHLPDMAGETRQPPVRVMGRSRGPVQGNNQGLKARGLEIADISRGEQRAVGAEEGMDPQVPGPAQGREQGRIEQGFAAGEAEVVNALGL